MKGSSRVATIGLVAILLFSQSTTAFGQALTIAGLPSTHSSPVAPTVSARSVVVMDMATGTLLYTKAPDLPIPPASLTKLVTLHLVYNELAAGRLRKDELVTIDPRDCSPSVPLGSSLMYLRPGMKVSVFDLMLGAAVVSGNDAAFALARRVAGSNEDFARLMNTEMDRLGFPGLRFVEPSGLSEKNMATASDFARFCRLYLKLHPQAIAELHSQRYIEFPRPEHSVPGFSPEGRILQYNKNDLVLDYPGCDGLKTGYIIEAGFNLAATAERDRTRFVIVTLGGGGATTAGGGAIRKSDGARLLDWAFANWKSASPPLPAIPPLQVWYGTDHRLTLVPGSDAAVTLPPSAIPGLAVRAEIPRFIEAPVAKGEKIGELIYTSAGQVVRRVNLVASLSIDRGNIAIYLRDSLVRFFSSIFPS